MSMRYPARSTAASPRPSRFQSGLHGACHHPVLPDDLNYSNNGYAGTVSSGGNGSQATLTSKVWAIEAIPYTGNSDPVPNFSAALSFQNAPASGCTY